MRTILSTLLLIVSTFSSAAAPPTKGVDLRLLSEVSTIQPGTPFTVGLHIHHQHGFHTYWQNPGIVGIPTQFDWTLPEGFSAGPIQWPAPEMVDMAGHPAHGFTRDVLLMVEITPPDTIAVKSVTLEAHATWMACATSCHPGNAGLSLTLPVARVDAPGAPNDQRFENARRLLPQALDSWNVTILSPANAPTIHLRVTAKRNRPHALSHLYFFSSDGQVSSDQPQRLSSPAPGSYELILQRAEFSPDHPTHLPGVLSGNPGFGPGHHRSVTINPRFPDKKTSPGP